MILSYKPLDLVDRTKYGYMRGVPVDISHVNDDMLKLINAARAERNLNPLACHPSLILAASNHAHDMADHNTLDHYGLVDHSTWSDRCRSAGYPGASLSTIGENIGGGQVSAEQLMGDYRNSPGHWAAIMNPQAIHCGSAAATGTKGWTYWCTDFGWSSQAPPTPNPVPRPNPRPRPWWLPPFIPWKG